MSRKSQKTGGSKTRSRRTDSEFGPKSLSLSLSLSLYYLLMCICLYVVSLGLEKLQTPFETPFHFIKLKLSFKTIDVSKSLVHLEFKI